MIEIGKTIIKFPPLREGILIKRYKRFLADVELADGEIVTAHCANTGPMKGVLWPGGRVRLKYSPSPKRKLDWSWEQAEVPSHSELKKCWVGINTSLPNKLIRNLIEANCLEKQFGSISTIKSETKTISSYIHNSQGDGIGKIAVLVALRCDENSKQIQDFGKQLAMHIAAAKPKAVSRDDLDPDLLSRERKILVEQAKDSGKPDAIIEKMVDGRIRKFYEEACLLEQTFVMDEDSKIADVIEQKAKDLSLKLSISGFSYFVLGEGIEKREEDFVTEVAAAGR